MPQIKTRVRSDLLAVPIHSAIATAEWPEDTYLHLWQVFGLCLEPLTALQFLHGLPLGAVTPDATGWGTDLRFWSHVARWGLDLLARAKVLPLLEPGDNNHTAVARWQPLLDSAVDQARLHSFARLMPVSCRTYQSAMETGGGFLGN